MEKLDTGKGISHICADFWNQVVCQFPPTQ